MATAFDLSPGFVTIPNEDFPTSGSFSFGIASSQDAFDFSGSLNLFVDPVDQPFVKGTWGGSALTYGAQVVFTSDVETVQTGSWFGSDATWGVNGPNFENHDKTHTVSDLYPSVSEGANVGEYNHFPIPEEPPEPAEKIRDATRFQKAYSFSRHQPVRVRIFKR